MSSGILHAPAPSYPVEKLFAGRFAYTAPMTLLVSGLGAALLSFGLAALTSGGKHEVAVYTFALLLVPSLGLLDALLEHSALGRSLRARTKTELYKAGGGALGFGDHLAHSLLKALSIGLFAPAFVGAMSGEADLWHNRTSGVRVRHVG